MPAQVRAPPLRLMGLLESVPNQGGRVMTKVEPAKTGAEGRKLMVRVELTPVVWLLEV